MRNTKVMNLTQGAMIAACYVVLCLVFEPISYGGVQVRIAEALTILPLFTPAAIPGLFIGCLLANLVTGAMIWDIIFGSLATLLGAIGTYYLRKTRFAFTLPPVIANMIVIPPVLMLAYHVPDAWWFLVITVGLGEVISVCILGFILKKALWNFRYQIFRMEERA